MSEHRPPQGVAPVTAPFLAEFASRYGISFDEILDFVDEATLKEQERTMIDEARAGAVQSRTELESLLEDLLNGKVRTRPEPKRQVTPVEEDEDEDYSQLESGPAPSLAQMTQIEPLVPAPGTVPIDKWWLRK